MSTPLLEDEPKPPPASGQQPRQRVRQALTDVAAKLESRLAAQRARLDDEAARGARAREHIDLLLLMWAIAGAVDAGGGVRVWDGAAARLGGAAAATYAPPAAALELLDCRAGAVAARVHRCSSTGTSRREGSNGSSATATGSSERSDVAAPGGSGGALRTAAATGSDPAGSGRPPPGGSQQDASTAGPCPAGGAVGVPASKFLQRWVRGTAAVGAKGLPRLGPTPLSNRSEATACSQRAPHPHPHPPFPPPPPHSVIAVRGRAADKTSFLAWWKAGVHRLAMMSHQQQHGAAHHELATTQVAVLCCAVLCCAVLCCAVLCCAVLPFAGYRLCPSHRTTTLTKPATASRLSTRAAAT
jgi:hypothetical protein